MRWLFQNRPAALDFALLMLRMAGGLMLLHGIPKLMNFNEIAGKFGDPIGIGPLPSLVLCILAEFFCVVFVLLGAFTRVALIPLLINMAVIIFIVHGNESLSDREKPLMFLVIYLVLFFTGAGKYSVDGWRKA